MSGSVLDLLDKQKIPNAEIKLLGQGIELQSNTFGDFLIQLDHANPQPDNELPFRFFHNVVLWDDALNLSFQINSLDGRTVLADQSSAGRYLLPQLVYGLYILSIEVNEERYAFKLFSDGIQTFIAEASGRKLRHQKSGSQLPLDTLQITAKGYFPRQIPLYPQDTVIRIQMLKGDYDNLHFLNELIDPLAYEILSSSPARRNIGGINTVKVIYNSEDGLE
ncbi:MAG: hypothetical protein AB8H47_20405 [Bacteroidia bacterium]